ncbi:MAG: nucleotidyltransferase domain-containing protein [Dehalococcoidia bacterium]
MVTTATELRQAIDDFIRHLQEGIRVEAVILYGSYAHGNPHEWSDIDLAVISPDFEGVLMPERQRIISRLTLHSHRRIEPIGYPSSEYHNPGRHSFLREIIRTGRLVYQADA